MWYGSSFVLLDGIYCTAPGRRITTVPVYVCVGLALLPRRYPAGVRRRLSSAELADADQL